jgi:hypothetical protein
MDGACVAFDSEWAKEPLEDAMNAKMIPIAIASALAAGATTAAVAQDTYMYRDNYTYRLAHAPDWNVAAADGMCRLRIWVDDRARVSLRGDQITVDTNSGKRSFDEGSTCTQPLPSSVADLRVNVERGRGQVIEVRQPDPGNNYAASMTIVDPQNGGDRYDLVVSWHNVGAPVAVAPAPVAPTVVATAPAPVYAPAPAYVPDAKTDRCQRRVRGQFLGRNHAPDAFLDFVSAPVREQVDSQTEVIRGEAWGGNRYESRAVSYQCDFNIHSSEVQAAYYNLHGPARRDYGMR